MKLMYTDNEGRTCLVYGASKEAIEQQHGPMTNAQYRAHIIARSIPEGADFVELPDDWTAPEDRTFRDAWAIRDGQLDVDMAKARDIQRDKLRRARKPLLEALDVEALRALEDGNSEGVKSIASRKKKLRDAPAHPSIERAKTPEELKAITLESITS